MSKINVVSILLLLTLAAFSSSSPVWTSLYSNTEVSKSVDKMINYAHGNEINLYLTNYKTFYVYHYQVLGDKTPIKSTYVPPFTTDFKIENVFNCFAISANNIFALTGKLTLIINPADYYGTVYVLESADSKFNNIALNRFANTTRTVVPFSDGVTHFFVYGDEKSNAAMVKSTIDAADMNAVWHSHLSDSEAVTSILITSINKTNYGVINVLNQANYFVKDLATTSPAQAISTLPLTAAINCMITWRMADQLYVIFATADAKLYKKVLLSLQPVDLLAPSGCNIVNLTMGADIYNQDLLIVRCDSNYLWTYSLINHNWTKVYTPSASSSKITNLLFNWYISSESSIHPAIIISDKAQVSMYDMQENMWRSLGDSTSWQVVAPTAQVVSSMIIMEYPGKTISDKNKNRLTVGLSGGQVAYVDDYDFLIPTPTEYDYFYKKKIEHSPELVYANQEKLFVNESLPASFNRIKTEINLSKLMVAQFTSAARDKWRNWVIFSYWTNGNSNCDYVSRFEYYDISDTNSFKSASTKVIDYDEARLGITYEGTQYYWTSTYYPDWSQIDPLWKTISL